MQNDVLSRQYKLIESWKLFVEEGIYKTDDLKNAEFKLWHQSKLLGANPLLEKIDVRSAEKMESKLKLDKEIHRWASDNKVSILIFDEEKRLMEKSKFEFNHLFMEQGALLEESIFGITALSLCVRSGEYKCLKGAHHYVKALQYHVMRAYPKKIDDLRYYFVFINHISKEERDIKKEIELQLENYLSRRLSMPKEEKKQTEQQDCGVFKLANIGKISFTSLSKEDLFHEGDNILSYFYELSIRELFRGKKQLVHLKNDRTEKYLISPISLENEEELSIFIERFESNLKFFSPLHRILNDSYADLIDRTALDPNFINRLKALTRSTMPVMFILDRVDEQILLSGLINTIRREYKNYYVNLDPKKNFNKMLNESLSEIERWLDFQEETNIHILHLDLLEKEDAYKTINTCFYSSNRIHKFFLYVSKEFYSFMKNEYNSVAENFKLNVMEIEEWNIKELHACFNGQNKEDLQEEQDEITSLKKRPSKKEYSLKKLEKNGIIDALLVTDYNLSHASKLLELSRSTLYRKLKEYDIKV